MRDNKDILFYLGRELVSLGVKNAPWVEVNCREAQKMFPTCQPAAVNAVIAAATHPYALDYFRQAPCLASEFCPPGHETVHSQSERHRIFTVWYERMHGEAGGLWKKKPTLHDVMTSAGMAYPLRKLKKEVFHTNHQLAWLPMISAEANHSTLSQSIPENSYNQRLWVRHTELWLSACMARNISTRDLNWFLKNYPFQEPVAASNINEVLDYIRDQVVRDVNFRVNPRWTWERITRAQEEWHARMYMQHEEEMREMTLAGVGVDILEDFEGGFHTVGPIDYAPFPNEPVHIGEYTFIPLRSQTALKLEGAAMRHCVGGYYHQVATGSSRIFSVLDGKKKRVATAEFKPPAEFKTVEHFSTYGDLRQRDVVLQVWDYTTADPKGRWKCEQLKGYRNAAVPAEIAKACQMFVEAVNRGMITQSNMVPKG